MLKREPFRAPLLKYVGILFLYSSLRGSNLFEEIGVFQ